MVRAQRHDPQGIDASADSQACCGLSFGLPLVLHKSLAGLVLLLGVGCRQEVREAEKFFEQTTTEGQRLLVTKHDSFTRSVGVITGHDYGTSHSYRYAFELAPDGIEWQGYASEPKQLVRCADKLYLRYLTLRHADIDVDAGADAGAARREPRVVSAHARHVDERWLFKLLGKQYWLEVPEAELQNARCQRLCDVPNDGELVLEAGVMRP